MVRHQDARLPLAEGGREHAVLVAQRAPGSGLREPGAVVEPQVEGDVGGAVGELLVEHGQDGVAQLGAGLQRHVQAVDQHGAVRSVVPHQVGVLTGQAGAGAAGGDMCGPGHAATSPIGSRTSTGGAVTAAGAATSVS